MKKKLTKERLLKGLVDCIKQAERDPETAHANADYLLLKYIHNKEIEEAYTNIIPKWYS